ncbi:siderophore synthetase component [Cytobacillus firmus]|uniref:Siderophore synthetase component n=2 Tax=Cytobacillus TaxID=2675230 RepID=A0A366K4P8_CYTFI|nr:MULTISPECIES: IucA/IucC family protein [Cytobacillus]RBP96654.1 siderophore synthetase component [Cytobacillus firmus]TDX45619.1 siderophore synthetase component [Cytobacillus oceanisediminis]
MTNHTEMAQQASMQSFLNCYLRETQHFLVTENWKPDWEVEISSKCLEIKLAHLDIVIYAAVRHWSLTGRHTFHFPLLMSVNGIEVPLDYVTLVSLISKELLASTEREGAEDELMLRAILSCRNIQRYLQEREGDSDSLQKTDFTFIEAEQSLLFGHLLHPTPKSKQGMTFEAESSYSPELKGSFQLHFFKADRAIVSQDSADQASAEEIIMELLQRDERFKGKFGGDRQSVFIPVHPLQVPVLLKDTEVQALIQSGKLLYIGPYGLPFEATSSMRTVYSPDFHYMFKFSVPVKITNSLRVNLEKELYRGVEVTRLMQSQLGIKFQDLYPAFRIIQDPAFMNIPLNKETSGFEVVIRENPFYENDRNASLIAGLVQDHAFGGCTRLEAIIHEIAEKENRMAWEVSRDWFEKYLSITLDPLIWLYETYGVALEAHQQNSIVQLENGYPSAFYYRDNQGYYFSESKAELLAGIIPDVSRKSSTLCSDDVAIERFRYYFFMNHLFGLINGFGTAGLADEEALLAILKKKLLNHYEKSGGESDLLKSLLEMKELPCKANLLTRFYDLDELVGSLETQSVYTKIPNPLKKVLIADEAGV